MPSIRRLWNTAGVLRQLAARNGMGWFVRFALNTLARRSFESTSRRLQRFEQKKGLPGFHDAELQRIVWNAYDWSRDGEEWTQSEEWKRSVVEALMLPQVSRRGDVLEIGPGGGRWSSTLHELANRLILVDVSATCIETCRTKFGHLSHVEFLVGDGRTLNGVNDASIDLIWSFDAFVHISAADTRSYFQEFARVLRPGGRAIIHHPGVGPIRGGFRSDTTTEAVQRIAHEAGLRVQSQIDSWTHDGRNYDVRWFGDMISIVEKQK